MLPEEDIRMNPDKSIRALLIAAFAAAALVFAANAARYLPSPLRFDETEFARQAGGILKHGTPFLYYPEDSRVRTRPFFNYTSAYYGMWHPPVYLYSLAASARFFGTRSEEHTS